MRRRGNNGSGGGRPCMAAGRRGQPGRSCSCARHCCRGRGICAAAASHRILRDGHHASGAGVCKRCGQASGQVRGVWDQRCKCEHGGGNSSDKGMRRGRGGNNRGAAAAAAAAAAAVHSQLAGRAWTATWTLSAAQGCSSGSCPGHCFTSTSSLSSFSGLPPAQLFLKRKVAFTKVSSGLSPGCSIAGGGGGSGGGGRGMRSSNARRWAGGDTSELSVKHRSCFLHPRPVHLALT